MFAEQVSARIVQEVTAEAVAVLKGEQESQRLPSGNTHTHTHIQTSKFIFDLLRLPGDLETKVQIPWRCMEKVSATRRGSEEAKKNPKKLLLFLFHPVFTDDAVLYHMTLDIVYRACFFFLKMQKSEQP